MHFLSGQKWSATNVKALGLYSQIYGNPKCASFTFTELSAPRVDSRTHNCELHKAQTPYDQLGWAEDAVYCHVTRLQAA